MLKPLKYLLRGATSPTGKILIRLPGNVLITIQQLQHGIVNGRFADKNFVLISRITILEISYQVLLKQVQVVLIICSAGSGQVAISAQFNYVRIIGQWRTLFLNITFITGWIWQGKV